MFLMFPKPIVEASPADNHQAMKAMAHSVLCPSPALADCHSREGANDPPNFPGHVTACSLNLFSPS
jgi:hypothetical protein